MGAVFHGSLTDHKAQLEKALRAFKQNPTPSLARSINRLQQAIKTQTKSAAKKGELNMLTTRPFPGQRVALCCDGHVIFVGTAAQIRAMLGIV